MMRRIITGHNPNGKSIIIQDGEPPRILTRPETPGVEVTEIWATHTPVPSLPVGDIEPTIEGWTYWPKPGATICRTVRFPPAAEIELALADGIDVVPAWRECLHKVRGEEIPAEYKDAGMHATDTIDYGIVLSGEIWMTLDSGEEIHLSTGDCVIQNGTNHAWCNKSAEPCIMAFILIGAVRENDR